MNVLYKAKDRGAR